MKDDCNWCNLPHGIAFKLSLLGALGSLLLALLSIIPPFGRWMISLPLTLTLAILLLIPSLMLYYSVRDKFWAEVAETTTTKKKKGRTGLSALNSSESGNSYRAAAVN